MGFSLVICSPTMRIRRGPNRNSPSEMPSAPITITQSGIATLAAAP